VEDLKRSKETASDQETEPETGLSDYPPIPPSSREKDQPLPEALAYLREAIRYSIARIRSHDLKAEQKTK